MNKENKLVPGLPSGFEDRWDKKLLLKKKLLKAIENNFIKFGAEALETPSFEISENIGSFLAEDDSNPMSDVFSFQDGEKSITLRYDLSSPLARFVAENNQELPSIFKRYQIQNVFRNEKAGNGRYREFMQADFDIVGNVNPAQANAELCNLISSTLSDCGLNKDQFTINVSNRKIVQGLIDELKISEEKQIKVIRAIDKLDKPGFGLKGVEDLLKKERKDQSGAITKGAELSDDQAAQILNFLKIKDLKELKQTLKNPLSQEGISELENVFEVLGYGSNLNQVKTVIEANHIVQRSGENFRKFIFSFIDQNGSELCLRPDLTIASCLRYLENNLKGKEKIFYSGQAYRKSQNKKDSIIRDQVGFEIIGSKDEKNDDKEIINTSLKSLQNIKYTSGTLTIGNVEIFNLLISKLDIPKRWKLRLSRHFWREKYFNDLLKRLETNSDVDPTIVEIDKKRYFKMLKEGPVKSYCRSIN